MLQATLLGADAELDRLWTEDYRSTGTFHALVISGSHVAVLAAVFLFLLASARCREAWRFFDYSGRVALCGSHRMADAGSARGGRHEPLRHWALLLPSC